MAMILGLLGGMYFRSSSYGSDPGNAEDDNINEKDKLKERILGAAVANRETLHALFIHGNFDEYHFFYPLSEIEETEKAKEELRSITPNANKIKVFDLYNLPSNLQDFNYSVLHNPGGPLMGELLYFRSRLSSQRFPVTAQVFSTSYHEMLARYLCQTIMPGPRVYDSLICSSNAAAQALKNIFNRMIESMMSKFHAKGLTIPRFYIIPHGVDVELYYPEDRYNSRKKLGIPIHGTIALWLGRLSAASKADLLPLLRAFKIALTRTFDEAFLILAGNDVENYGEKIRQLASELGIYDNVILKPDVSEMDKILLYSSANMFITPSDNIQESFGLSLLEAMAFGLPVIASDWDGYREIVIDSETGFRIPTYWAPCDEKIVQMSPVSNHYGFERDHLYLAQSVCVDIKIMADRIATLINNRKLSMDLGNNARRYVLQKYDWKVVIKAYEEIWAELREMAQRILPSEDKYILRTRYFCDYMHYPTKVLNDLDQLQTTLYGMDVLEESVGCPVYDEMQSFLSFDIICHILELATSSTTLGYIKELLSQKHNVPTHEITYHIMWMLKNDLLELH